MRLGWAYVKYIHVVDVWLLNSASPTIDVVHCTREFE